MTPAELAALERRVIETVLARLRQELESDKRKTLSELEHEWRNALTGLEQHLERRVSGAAANAARTAVDDALAPYLGGVDKVRELATLIVEARADRDEVHVVLGEATKALNHYVALETAKLELAKERKADTDAKVLELETTHKRRIATITAVAALISALAALGGASCNSWFQKR